MKNYIKFHSTRVWTGDVFESRKPLDPTYHFFDDAIEEQRNRALELIFACSLSLNRVACVFRRPAYPEWTSVPVIGH
jgi:hypothetical protein